MPPELKHNVFAGQRDGLGLIKLAAAQRSAQPQAVNQCRQPFAASRACALGSAR